MRYIAKLGDTTSWWDREVPQLSHPLVIVSDPVFTGLVDAQGRKMYRVPDQIGFMRSEDLPNLGKSGK